MGWPLEFHRRQNLCRGQRFYALFKLELCHETKMMMIVKHKQLSLLESTYDADEKYGKNRKAKN